ncbi:MAG: PD-(D/E)XK nuclease family protein [Flavobacteriaceae bacterium]|nr:PD-(D/E)XK nuclease family protein [Flavobacteriaceae bacterium]
MQTFLSDTLNDILKTTKSFNNVVMVLPSQRAKVFLKKELKNKINIGVLPQILSIEEFIAEISEAHQIDSIQLLFEFYNVYTNIEKAPDSFDLFSSWASVVLQDFNELDQHLVNTKDIFSYIRDIERLKKWSVKGTFKETDLIKNHHSFLEKLNEYYNKLYDYLISKKIGYQGLLYRESCKKVDQFLQNNKQNSFCFIGFNALNKAEEYIFQKFLEKKTTSIYWDIDKTFYNNNHLASKFIRKYNSEWKYYEHNEIKFLADNFSNSKNIAIVGASKNITQIKYVGEILAKNKNYKNAALVLADETLLPVTLNSLPRNIEDVNITMGYPLKDIPLSGLFKQLFQLFLTQDKLNKKEENVFYFKDVIQFLKNPNIYTIITNVDVITTDIAKKNISFVSDILLENYLVDIESNLKTILLSIFKKYISIEDFLDRIINLIQFLKEHSNSLNNEYLYRFFTVFNQLKTYQNSFEYFKDLKTLSQFYQQLLTKETLSFQGEPLKGLQLMGMLETRVLDFENVILVAANENILPANFQANSFIPFDVKVEYGLPTYREKDAIFAYHFFRLIQRAKNITILYNTEADSLGSSEKSRFVKQLEILKPNCLRHIISPEVITEKTIPKQIEKNDIVLNRLKEIATAGISPSSLTNYLRNPITFYKQKILAIRELDEVEETIAANTLGTVVHDVLDELYKPLIGTFLNVDVLQSMKKRLTNLIEKHFTIQFKNGDISTGKNRLIFEVANRFVENFLDQEIKVVQKPENQLKIIATEEELSTTILVYGIDFPIKLHGKVDRVDELNGELRIIDYKTGKVEITNLKINNFIELKEEKLHKAIQVLLYAYLYTNSKNYDFSKPLKAGVYSFKNLNAGFLAVTFNEKPPTTNITQEKLVDFIAEIKGYIQELYNPNEVFKEDLNAKY